MHRTGSDYIWVQQWGIGTLRRNWHVGACDWSAKPTAPLARIITGPLLLRKLCLLHAVTISLTIKVLSKRWGIDIGGCEGLFVERLEARVRRRLLVNQEWYGLRLNLSVLTWLSSLPTAAHGIG